MTSITKAAVVGGGVIGGGWAARLVLNGIDVAIFDPDPEAERKIGEVLALADRAFAKLTYAPPGRRGALTLREERGGSGGRSGVHPGERAGAAGAEAETVRRDRRACAARMR